MDVILASTSFLASPGIGAWGSLAGDTAHAALGLAKGLRSLGHRATLVAPLEAHAAHAGLGLARRLSPLPFEISGVRHERTIHDARLPSGVEIVLLGGDGPGEGATPDDVAQRCAWFGHAVAALARQRLGGIAPRAANVPELEAVIAIGEGSAFTSLAIREDAKVTAHDGGPSPRLLAGLARISIPLDPASDHTLPPDVVRAVGVTHELFTPEGVEFYGRISLSKAAALASDKIVTLGEAPRAALVAEGAPHRLDGVYRARTGDIVSIGSGVDQAQYNPATDPHIATRFDPEETTGKARCRSSLLAELELEPLAEAPLVALVAGGEAQLPGSVATALGRALRGEILLIVALAHGTGDGEFDRAIARIAKTHPRRVAVRHSATEPLLHRAVAAADFALIVDPTCQTGTAARAAMRYGTVPIALRTPGVDEAVVDLEASLVTGNGFVFASTDIEHVFGAVQRAASAFASPQWAKIRRRVMRIEGGWERAARRLESVIQQLEE